MNSAPTHQPFEDDFWTHDTPLFHGSFRYYKNISQPVRGKIHVSNEGYYNVKHEIVPIATPKGERTYIMLHPYVFEPEIILTVGLHNQPKRYADQESPIGKVISSRQQGIREREIGNAQAWYYHQDKTIVLWECYLHSYVRDNPLLEDENMKQLWKGFEKWLVKQFPKATRIVTPFNDPIAQTIEEYQQFLRSLDYEPVEKAAFGKMLSYPSLQHK